MVDGARPETFKTLSIVVLPAMKVFPTLLMVKSVEVEKLVVEEPMVKSWVVVVASDEVGVANSEMYAVGEVEPMPRAPAKK